MADEVYRWLHRLGVHLGVQPSLVGSWTADFGQMGGGPPGGRPVLPVAFHGPLGILALAHDALEDRLDELTSAIAGEPGTTLPSKKSLIARAMAAQPDTFAHVAGEVGEILTLAGKVGRQRNALLHWRKSAVLYTTKGAVPIHQVWCAKVEDNGRWTAFLFTLRMVERLADEAEALAVRIYGLLPSIRQAPEIRF